jgi:bacteriocin-like protein
MSDEIHELSIDELDTVSGGHVSTATVVAAIEAGRRYFQYEVQRYFGSRGASPISFL